MSSLAALELEKSIEHVSKATPIMQQRIETMQQRTNEAIQDLAT